MQVPNPELESKVILHSNEDSEFVDPITNKLMCDPVKGSDDCTYDRWTIINTGEFSFDQQRVSIRSDDVELRERLFTKFHLQGVEAICSERRRAYRKRALELAKEGQDDEALIMLDNVLEWDEGDTECQNWRQAIVQTSESMAGHEEKATLSAIIAEDLGTDSSCPASPERPPFGSMGNSQIQAPSDDVFKFLMFTSFSTRSTPCKLFIEFEPISGNLFDSSPKVIENHMFLLSFKRCELHSTCSLLTDS